MNGYQPSPRVTGAPHSARALQVPSRDSWAVRAPGLSDDVLVARDVPAHYAEVIAIALIAKFSPRENDEHYFKVVPDDYVLRTYEP